MVLMGPARGGVLFALACRRDSACSNDPTSRLGAPPPGFCHCTICAAKQVHSEHNVSISAARRVQVCPSVGCEAIPVGARAGSSPPTRVAATGPEGSRPPAITINGSSV
jgi:hypothetical protein